MRPAWLEPDRAWPLLAAAFSASLLSTGLRFAAGPLVTPLTRDLGLEPRGVGAVMALAMATYGLGLLAAGALSDRLGAHRVVAGGAAVLAASLALAAWARSAAAFALAYGVAASAGFAATGPTALAPLLARWFPRRRALAMTFLSAGSMAGIALLTPLVALLVARLGWRAALLAAAAAAGSLLLAAARTLAATAPRAAAAARGDAGSAHGPAPATPLPRTAGSPVGQAVRTVPFWLLAGSFGACGFSMNLFGTFGVPMLEGHGFGPVTASLGVGAVGLTSIGGSLLVGAAADRYGRARVLALVYLARAAGFVGLLRAATPAELYAISATSGLVWAGSMALTSALLADLFGTGRLGSLVGLAFVIHQAGGALGALAAGWAAAAWGSYDGAFVLAAVNLAAAAALVLGCGPTPRKTGAADPAAWAAG